MKPSTARKSLRVPEPSDALLPVLSLMLLLIPLLVGKVAFSHLTATDAQLPLRSTAAPPTPTGAPSVVAHLVLGTAEHWAEAVDEKTGARLSRLRLFNNESAPALIRTELRRLQKRYRSLDTVLVTTDPTVPYARLVEVLAALETQAPERGIQLPSLKLVLVPSGGV